MASLKMQGKTKYYGLLIVSPSMLKKLWAYRLIGKPTILHTALNLIQYLTP